jgi:hypothetical protein
VASNTIPDGPVPSNLSTVKAELFTDSSIATTPELFLWRILNDKTPSLYLKNIPALFSANPILTSTPEVFAFSGLKFVEK